MSDARKIEKAYWSGWTEGYKDGLKRRNEEDDDWITAEMRFPNQIWLWAFIIFIFVAPFSLGMIIGHAT